MESSWRIRRCSSYGLRRGLQKSAPLALVIIVVLVGTLCLHVSQPIGRPAFVGSLAAADNDVTSNTVLAPRQLCLAWAVGLSVVVGILAGLKSRIEMSNTQKWRGVDVKKFAGCLFVGWFIRFVLPIPGTVTTEAWSMLAIFAAMIFAVVTEPMPPAATTIVAISIAVLSKTISFADAVRAFTDDVVWLVCIAFFFADGFRNTGLGNRIAYTVIKLVGSTTLGLAYGLNVAELGLAAAMPSSAARSAAIFFPIVVSIAKASGSDPDQKTEKRCGAFLVECAYQATATSSCLFLPGAAQNYFVLKLAAGVGVDVPSPFRTWFMAALGPALASFLLSPAVAFYLMPPQTTKTPEAPAAAKQKLLEMGPLKDTEVVFGSTILGMVTLWATASTTGIPPVVTAFCGLAVMLLTGVLSWDDCAKNTKAWGTLISFAALVGLAAMLNNLGIVQWLAKSITVKVLSAGLGPKSSFLVILGAYWCIHYLFASQVAQVGALYQPFLLMMIETGSPGLPAALALAFVSNLFMTLTPYASAQSAVFYGGQYITSTEWYRVGLAYAIFYFCIWVGVGAVWWKMIGLI